MLRVLLKSKIQFATVTDSRPEDDDILLIDREILKKAGIWPNERVELFNRSNGARLSMAITGAESLSGIVSVGGAIAHLVKKGHEVTICSYAYVSEGDLPAYQHRLVHLDRNNRIR